MTVTPIRAKRAELHLRTDPECRRGPLAAPPAHAWLGPSPAPPAHAWLGALLGLLLAVLALSAISPPTAAADGPVTPTATDYLARITRVPAGVEAKVVDGYLNLWMRVPAGESVVVLDFRGAPWVRFDGAGVQVNHNSLEYYNSQVPVPALAPSELTRSTPPRWVSVSSGHTYMWREGRMHALAAIALAPGTTYVGKWTIAMRVAGRPATLVGGLWYTGPPSIVWFWPILVFLSCALAAWRLRSPELDRRLGKAVTLALLVLIGVAMAARYLHGRPGISAGNAVLLLAIMAALAAAAGRVLGGRSGLPLLLATALVALWAGLTLITVLTHGYVLLAVPAFVARAVTAALIGGSLSLALIGVRALDRVAA
jgi:hypothetical protein